MSESTLRLIFGGTFNPLHKGHTGAIEALERILPMQSAHFVLSARPPHKSELSASIRDRYTMLELALSDYDNYFADDTEIMRPTISYTVDTVVAFKQRFPNSNLAMVIGADSLLRLPLWYRIEQWIDDINWIVLARPGYDTAQAEQLKDRFVESAAALMAAPGGAIWLFEETQFDISSTNLRRCLQALGHLQPDQQALLDTYLAPQVQEYIHTHSLYRL